MRTTATADEQQTPRRGRPPKKPWITPVVLGLYVIALVVFLLLAHSRP